MLPDDFNFTRLKNTRIHGSVWRKVGHYFSGKYCLICKRYGLLKYHNLDSCDKFAILFQHFNCESDRVKRIFINAVDDVKFIPDVHCETIDDAEFAVHILEAIVTGGTIPDDKSDIWLGYISDICDALTQKVIVLGRNMILQTFAISKPELWFEFIPFYNNGLHRRLNYAHIC